jgi:hypothetical protein
VAFHVELHETRVAPYLDGLELSAEGREALMRVVDELGEYGDGFIYDAERRLTPGSEYFIVRWIFRDRATNTFHAFRMIVSDAAAPFGVLRVEYADEETAVFPGSFST